MTSMVRLYFFEAWKLQKARKFLGEALFPKSVVDNNDNSDRALDFCFDACGNQLELSLSLK